MLAAGRREGESVRLKGLAEGVGGIWKRVGARIGMAYDGREGVYVVVDSVVSLTGRVACQTVLMTSKGQSGHLEAGTLTHLD